MEDLFLYPELIPEQVQNILDSRDYELGYKDLERINNELNKIGYEFDYGLDAEPYYLTKLKTKNMEKTIELIENGQLDTDDLKSTFMCYLSDKHNIDWSISAEYTDEYFENLLSIDENENNFIKWYNDNYKN